VLSLPFEAPSPDLPIALGLRVGDLSCLGFLPHRGVPKGVHLCAGMPALAKFRPQVFPTSRRLAPPLASRACFIPQPRPGFFRSGASPRLARASALRRDLTPMPLVLACSPTETPPLLAAPLPAATYANLDFEVLLRDPMRSSSWLFKPSTGRSPLRFPPPSGLPDTTVSLVPQAIRS